jgi:hypothetical protein
VEVRTPFLTFLWGALHPTPPISSGPAGAELCRSCAPPAHQLAWPRKVLLDYCIWIVIVVHSSLIGMLLLIDKLLYLILSLICFALSWKITPPCTHSGQVVRARGVAHPPPPPPHTHTHFKTGSAFHVIHIQIILKISVIQLKWIYIIQKMSYMSLNTRVECHSYTEIPIVPVVQFSQILNFLSSRKFKKYRFLMLRIWFLVLRNYFSLKQENHIFWRKLLIWRWKNRKKTYSCFKKTNIILMLRIWFLVLRKYFLKQENHIFVRKYILVLRKQI